jgi:hypothetical protein
VLLRGPLHSLRQVCAARLNRRLFRVTSFGLTANERSYTMTSNAKPDFRVRTTGNNGKKTFYHDLGVAWRKDNGVISAKLYGAPINGVLIFVPNDTQAETTEAGE